MRIAIMGTGGVGGYFGARLAQGGADVRFIARGAHLAALRQDGLKITSKLGDLHLPKVAATDDPSSLDQIDLVLIGVKLWDTESAAQAVQPLVARGAAVVSFQNGVEKDQILRESLGAASVFGGVSYIAASIAGPGLIAHTGMIQRLVFGEYDGSASARTTALLDACRRGGIDAEISGDIERAIWEKFVFLVGLSGTTTATRQRIGAIRANPETRALLLETMREVVAVASARGIALAADFAEQRLAFCDSLPAEMTSSMHGDLERGSRLEVSWLSGAVAKLGAASGVATPINRAISAVLALYAEGRP